MKFDEKRIDEFNTLCNLLEEVKSLNKGSGFLERVARCIERAEQLTATDWETRRKSFRQWLRDGLCEMHQQAREAEGKQ